MALYLALTMAPFAVVAPLLGPVLDRSRGGRRLVVIASAGARAVLCLFMADDINSLLLFPEAFCVLVASKTYTIAKSALVPAAVDTVDELVEANSKLQLLGVSRLASPRPSLASPCCSCQRCVGTASGRAACSRPAPSPRSASARPRGGRRRRRPHERAELRAAGIVLAASAMGLLRATGRVHDVPRSRSGSAKPTRRRGGSASCSRRRWAEPSSAREAPRLRRTRARGAHHHRGADRPRTRRSAVSGRGVAIGGCGPRSWPAGSRWRRLSRSWPSTRSCSATRPTQRGAGRSPASRPASSSCGWPARSCRSWSRSRWGLAS